MRTFIRVGAFAALVALAAGCGTDGEYGDVTGAVTYDGQPVADGAITFTPADGKGQSGGGVIKDGRYTATKVSAGAMKVHISGSKEVGKKKVYPTPNSPEMAVTAELLPPKYSDKDKTELTFEVKRGPNAKDWALER